MTYRATPVTQRDGSTLQYSNCLMAAAAVGLDFHTLGGKTSTGAKMRRFSGDTAGGTNTDEIERAWHTGYDEDPITRDGQPWQKVLDDLAESRLVMLQVWAATVGDDGGMCLSGSGQYGHGICLAPESRVEGGTKQWLVADPWCKPPRWGWVNESRLAAGAERWAGKVSYAVGGERDLSKIDKAVLRVAVKLLMSNWTPDDPAEQEPPGVKGTTGVLFASTRPQAEGDDVSINTNGSRITSVRRVTIQGEAGFYADAKRTEKYGTITGGDRVFMGPANGSDSHAIIVETSKPYSDGEKRPTIVYVAKSKCSDPFSVGDPVEERDAAWRAWIDTDMNAPDKA